jgi:EAL domain-containing protein (putative c-di-GMP-specific phosphodiesterase class I)
MPQLPKTHAEGQWHWHATARHLFIEVPRDSGFTGLQGDWALPDLDLILDGLSRGRLGDAFASAQGSVAVNIRLSDGRDVHFAGGFISPIEARGFLLTDPEQSQIDPADLEPGPDLIPYFQPILSLRDGRVAGFEALARWDTGAATRTPPSAYDDEALAPNMLIRAAETLSELRAISRQNNLFMHVNFTARDLGKPNLPALIEALMHGYDLPPESMKVELTEQAALRNAENALAAAYSLKKAGVGLVLDDFGTGHSSFEWLADLPADSVKIDPGLTQRLGQPRTDTILSTITLLAQRLGMTATAEGVERKEDASRLRQLGFDHVQGFAFARPMDAAAARAWIRNFK